MTTPERKLWVHLRALKKERGWQFRRQAPLETYIVDFVCFPARLVIEADGGQHNEPAHRAAAVTPPPVGARSDHVHPVDEQAGHQRWSVPVQRRTAALISSGTGPENSPAKRSFINSA